MCRTVHKQLFAELFQTPTDLEGTANTIMSMEFAKGTHTLGSHFLMAVSIQGTPYPPVKPPKGPQFKTLGLAWYKNDYYF